MSIQRITKGVPATLRLVTRNEAEAPVNSGTVTVGIVDASGTTVVASGTAVTTDDGSGTYTYTLPARSTLGALVVSFTNGTTTWTIDAEVVAGRYFTIADAQASHIELTDGGDFTDAAVALGRDAVEIEIEDITGLSFVRRRTRVVVNGTGTTVLPVPVRYVRRIVSGEIVATFGSSGTALTAAQIAAVALDDVNPPESCTGLLTRTDGVWPAGHRNVVLVLEHGYDAPPADIYRAALRLLYNRLHDDHTEVLDKATSFAAAGGTFALATATKTSTGIKPVDAVLDRYSRLGTGGKAAAASGTLRLSRNRAGSLFHR